MLLGLYLFLVIALPLVLGGIVACNGLPRSRLCPLCMAETFRIRSRRHALASRLLGGEELHARWCPSCEWEGTVRVARPLYAAAPAPGEPRVVSPGLEIRRVELGAEAWQVRLECWSEGDEWHGRLLFVGPGGRAWTDGRPLLTGQSALDVLSQVLTLSDRALVGRIKKATR